MTALESMCPDGKLASCAAMIASPGRAWPITTLRRGDRMLGRRDRDKERRGKTAIVAG